MTCQHRNVIPVRGQDRPAHNERGHGVLRPHRCLDCGEGVGRFLLHAEVCPNCSDPSAEGGHLGAQGWLCQPTPEVVQAALLANAVLSASRARGV